MKNLSRITNYGNKQEAWKLWNDIAAIAAKANKTDLALENMPAENASWRKVDAASSRLFAALKAVEQTLALDLPLECPHCKALQANSHDQYCPLSGSANQ